MHAQLATLLGAEVDRLYPMELAKAHPRIIDRIAELWNQGSALEDYFDELLVDRRGNRIGFSEPVLLEIFALRNHYIESRRPQSLGPNNWGELTDISGIVRPHA